VSQPHFEGSVRSPLTLPKMGLGSPPGLPKTQSAIAGAKTPRIEAFFIPLERSWSLDDQNGSYESFGHLQHKLWSKEGPGVKLAIWLPNTKVGNRLDSGASRWSATHCWKALDNSYNFGLDLVSIRVRGEELWASKVSGVQTELVSGLHFGSPGKKSHLDASAAERCREYYMGEGGGFPRVQAVVNQMSPR
jgi:hypothetical protein